MVHARCRFLLEARKEIATRLQLHDGPLQNDSCLACPRFSEGVFLSRGMLIPMIKNAVRFATLSFCLGSMIACAQGPGRSTSAPAKLETEEQKTLYALGLLLGRNIKPFALRPEELAIVQAGLTDAVTDTKPQVEIDAYGPKVN